MKDNSGSKAYFIGIYWGPRRETTDQCIRKTKATIDGLRKMDASFSDWYKATSPQHGESPQALPLDDPQGMEKLLLDGQIHDDEGQLMADLGYTVYLKSNPAFNLSHILSMLCGSFNEFTSNRVTLNLGRSEEYAHLQDLVVARKIYEEFVRLWKPDKGVIQCNDQPVVSDKW
jgi:hypothetical protein